MFMAYLVDVRRIMSTSAKGLFSSTLEWLVREEFDAVLGWKESVSSAYASSLSGRAFLHPSGRLDMLQGIHNATLELVRSWA